MIRLLLSVLVAGITLASRPVAAQTADDLFDPSALHDLAILMNARDWAQLRATFMENTYYPCDVEWRGVRARNAACRSRGSGSRNGVKPGLRIDFNHYVSGQTFLGLDALVLDNFASDPSMLRERLSMTLLERLGLPVPRESYVRVVVGSEREYVGLYAAVEEIDDEFLKHRFSAGGGYLYEYHWVSEYHFEDLGPELEPYATLFEPRMHEQDSMFTLFTPIRDLVAAINESDSRDLGTALAPLLALAPFVTQLAAENFLAEWDGLVGYAGLNNFYLYRPPDTGRFRLLSWDKDSTFAWLQMPPAHNFDENVLTRKLWANDLLRQQYLQELLRAAAAARDMTDDVTRLHELIGEAALNDRLKPYSNQEFSDAVDDVRRFARERAAVVGAFVRPLLSPADIGSSVAGSR